MPGAVRALPCTEFATLLARAEIQQAEFTDITARQVNTWAAAAPPWRNGPPPLAIALAEVTPDELEIRLEEGRLRVARDARRDRRRRCRHGPENEETGGAHLSPGRWGAQDQMTRINAAYEAACASAEGG
jgi:hypothetical protein